ncbi:AraC family transcriptional regulator [Poriferisphaera sp. WC338]|uniref:AraC family transcriptional regulator n=1 Tax=Poriferisphaera sp. WC338 TaxID=3425129 RepID=UPI003D819915
MWTEKYTIDQFLRDEEWFHVRRAEHTHLSRLPLHRQNYPEVFWLERGRGEHHINGKVMKVNAGDLIMMRAGDRHTLLARRDERFVICNIAFRQSLLQQLRKRYGFDEHWVWQGDGRAGVGLPSMFGLVEKQMMQLKEWANELAAGTQSRFTIERFLINVIDLLMRDRQVTSEDNCVMPDWFYKGLQKYRQLEVRDGVCSGASELATLCDKSVEHVNRMIKEVYGVTATQYLNQLRIEKAAQLLRMTGLSIVEVGAQAGYENHGYFYKRFKAHYGMTPRKYRLAAQRMV